MAGWPRRVALAPLKGLAVSLRALARGFGLLSPAQAAVCSFALVILAGTLALGLPGMVHGPGLGFLDCLFTATSATCVTGLIVVDTGTRFTVLGQGVILTLIQVGGFGIVGFSTFILFMAGKRAPLKVSAAVGGSFLTLRHYNLNRMIVMALGITLVIELVGAGLLFPRFVLDMPPLEAAWHAFFHSVSAFCNAGFALQPDSLMPYAGDYGVNAVVIALIILGGAGYFVIIDLFDTLRRHPDPARRRVSLHTKLVLFASLALILGGALVFYLVERGQGLAGLSPSQAFMRALFGSVTARTAGFNTVDIGALSNASLFTLIWLMFIGGAPGSMAGGVKVTTAAVIVVLAVSRLRRRVRPTVFGRAITPEDLERAITLVLLAAAFIGAATLLLLISELGGRPHTESRGLFLEILFEAVSAFGTVGLSTGVTPSLSPVGKVIITLLMFAGRLGPVTLIFSLGRERKKAAYTYPGEKIIVG